MVKACGNIDDTHLNFSAGKQSASLDIAIEKSNKYLETIVKKFNHKRLYLDLFGLILLY